MEEDKIESEKNEEIKENHKKHGFCGHHACFGHKYMRAFLIAVLFFAIFSIGVSFGSHLNRGGEGYYQEGGNRGFKMMNNFEQRGDGRMERGNRLNYGGGCQMQAVGQIQGGCPMQNAGASVQGTNFQVPASCPMLNQTISPVTSVVPVKAVTPAAVVK